MEVSDALEAALQANRATIEEALDGARDELANVRDRERELVRLINRAEIALGILEADASPLPVHASDLTLHEAMAEVLRGRGAPMSAREIADEVNRQGLYRKGDGTPLDTGQVHARVHRYGHMFRRRDRKIELAELHVVDSGQVRTGR